MVLLRAPRSPTKSKGETIRIPRYILYCVVPKVVPGRPAQTRVEVEVRDQANRIRRSGSKTQGWEKEIGRGKRGMRGASVFFWVEFEAFNESCGLLVDSTRNASDGADSFLSCRLTGEEKLCS